MKIKELTKDILEIVVPEKDLEIVSPKAANAFVQALKDSKKVSKFQTRLNDCVEASQMDREERLAMLSFSLTLDESQSKEFDLMKKVFSERDPKSQNTRKDIAKVLNATSDLKIVLEKMVKKEGDDNMSKKNKGAKGKVNKKEKEVNKKEEVVVDEAKKSEETKINEIVSMTLAIAKDPKLLSELMANVKLIDSLFEPYKDVARKVIATSEIENKEEAIITAKSLLGSTLVIAQASGKYAEFAEWLKLVLECKSYDEILKHFNLKQEDIKEAPEDKDPLTLKGDILVTVCFGDRPSEEVFESLTKFIKDLPDVTQEIIKNLEETENELASASKVSEQAAENVHAAVQKLKKETIKPDANTLYNQSSEDLGIMVDNGSLVIGETYVVKVGKSNYTARLICKAGGNYSLELGDKVSSF